MSRILVQRVKRAEVRVNGEVLGKIQHGLLVYVGIHHTDTVEEVHFLAQKVIDLRIFQDDMEKMNLSIRDVQGSILAISQFTLYGDASKGRRPTFIEAAPPALAKELYDKFVEKLKELLGPYRVAEGRFAAHMEIDYINDGPVSLILDKSHLR